MIMGIGVPVDLQVESVTIGYVFKCEYFLPDNASNYLNPLADPFDITPRPITGTFRKARDLEEQPKPLKESSGYDEELQQRFETYEVQPVQVDAGSDAPLLENNLVETDYWKQEDGENWSEDPERPDRPQNFATSRWSIYKGMAEFARKYDDSKYFTEILDSKFKI